VHRRPRADGQPEDLIYEKLPRDIAERHVLLMDPILSTGNCACRAIQVRRRLSPAPHRTAPPAQPPAAACRCLLLP